MFRPSKASGSTLAMRSWAARSRALESSGLMGLRGAGLLLQVRRSGSSRVRVTGVWHQASGRVAISASGSSQRYGVPFGWMLGGRTISLPSPHTSRTPPVALPVVERSHSVMTGSEPLKA